MDKKRDNIYIYLWEEFNTVYVGRTVNPKGRHYQHKHREKERTYKFSSEHHVEHPKMIIIENNLSIEEGVEREKYWINYYKNESNYDVLNKSKGGQVGHEKIYTDEELKEHQKEYREKNKENRKIKKKEYYQRNKEKIIEKQKKYYNNNKEKILEKNRNYYQENKEAKKEKQKLYTINNKEKIRERQKKYYDLHKEDIENYRKKYREEHREELRIKQRLYYKSRKNI